jgi:hypothetical protein
MRLVLFAAALTALPESASASAITDQQWIGPSKTTKQTIFLKSNTKLCLSAKGTSNGQSVELETCTTNNNLQTWTYDMNTTELKLIGSPKVCLDLTGGSTAAGTKLQVWQCNGLVQQKWIAAGIFQFLSQAMGSECIDVPGSLLHQPPPTPCLYLAYQKQRSFAFLGITCLYIRFVPPRWKSTTRCTTSNLGLLGGRNAHSVPRPRDPDTSARACSDAC